MNAKWHFITSGILAVILLGYFGIWSVFIFIGGFFLDFDHYLYYGFLKKDWNHKNCFKYFDFYNYDRACIDELHVFHTIEFAVMLIVLSFFFEFAFAVLIGMALHILLDKFDAWRRNLKAGRVPTIYGWLLGMHSETYYDPDERVKRYYGHRLKPINNVASSFNFNSNSLTKKL